MKKFLILGPMGILVFWFFLTTFKVVSPILLPSPTKVFATLFLLFSSNTILPDLLKTLSLWIPGLCIGFAIGIPIGILMGYSDKIYASFEILIDFFRSLPSIVLYPLFIVFFGLGDLPKIAIVIFATSLYTAVNTIYGVKYGRESRLMVAKALKANKWQTFSKVILPAALPEISAGLRVSLSIGLIVTIGSEMILGANFGLGKRVLDASMVYNMSEMYAIIILVGLLGYFSNKLFVLIEEKVIHWRGK